MVVNNKGIEVTSIFPIREKQYIYARLISDEWDFRSFGLVYLCFDNKTEVCMYYKGYGNINSTPVLMLIPSDSYYKYVEDICSIEHSQIYIKRGDK